MIDLDRLKNGKPTKGYKRGIVSSSAKVFYIHSCFASWAIQDGILHPYPMFRCHRDNNGDYWFIDDSVPLDKEYWNEQCEERGLEVRGEWLVKVESS